METLFAEVLSMSATGCFVIAAVLLARLLLKRAPKILSYALWAVVLVRLVFPLSFSSPYYGVPRPDGLPALQFARPGTAMQAISPEVDQLRQQATGGASLLSVLSLIWAAGIVIMLLYGVLSYGKLRKMLVGSVRLRENIYMADYLPTPFVMGLLRPKIYLPSALEDWEKPYILAHEQHHIRRLDHLAKPLGFLALCLHWFNPLVWLSFLLFCKDMEMSCDEAVIKKLGESVRADYSAALLSLATGHRIIAGMPLAFGEGDTKGRIQNMKNWKKPVLWIVVIAAICCALLAVFLLTDKKEETDPDADARQLVDALVSSIQYEDQTIRFTVPAGAEQPEDWVILISGRAGYPDGMTMSRHYLEGTVWEAGKEYSIDLSEEESALLELGMYIFCQGTEQEIDLTALLESPLPDSEQSNRISAAQNGRQVLVDLAFYEAPAAQLAFTLPEGVVLGAAENAPDRSGYLLNDRDGKTIGEFFFMGLATEPEDLQSVETDKSVLPMQIFAFAALPNHVLYEDYQVQTFTETGAAATAVFSSQDLSLMDTGEYDAAAAIPLDNRKNLVLFYDYEKLPVFLQISLDEMAFSRSACAEIAESVVLQ